MRKTILQLTALVAPVGVAMLITAGVQAAHVTLTANNELYPVVGNPLDLNLPFLMNELSDEYYDIARNPQDVPSEPLDDGATITIFAYDHTSDVMPAMNPDDPPVTTVTALAPKNFGDTNCDDSQESGKPCWAGGGQDVIFEFFAFGGGQSVDAPLIPAPFLRVTAGNTFNINLVNRSTTLRHAIDFHAIVGKKGGAAVVAADPGKASGPIKLTIQDPGLYIYHCVGEGTPHGIAHHMNNGMVGLILVEPRGGGGGQFTSLTKNATEHYVMEFDIYRENGAGPRNFDEGKMIHSQSPDHVVYNGRVGALIDHPLVAEVGKNAVIYHGVAGVHVASFHIIGEIFDWVFDLGDIISVPLRNIQTQTIPSAGAAVLIMDGNQLVPTDLSGGLGPDLNILVDHASSQFRKGALGVMVVCPIAGVCP